MRIAIAYAPPMRRWQQRLADVLRGQGHEVAWMRGEPRRPGIAISAALAFEQRLLGPRPSLFDAIDDAARILPREAGEGDHAKRGGGGCRCSDADRSFPEERQIPNAEAAAAPSTILRMVPLPRASHRGGYARRDPGALQPSEADLVIVLDGIALDAPFVLEPVFDGATGDAALVAMLTAGRSPHVEVRTRAQAETIDVVAATLAVSDRDVLSRALDQVLARIVTLIVKSVRRFAEGERAAGSDFQPSDRMRTPSALSFMARAWRRKIVGRLSGKSGGPSHWRVGYRRLGDALTILPDDGTRFYADPVPFEHEGRHFLFVEDYPYATAKGVIGVTEIATDGAAPPVRQVLEQPFHLSYPHLVRHGGEIYMLPEMSAARRVQLFRAETFPDRWVADRVLLDDIVAADATLIEHAGRWWMFAALADDGGSSWDQLCLFHAPDLLGPWVPHAANPVLVDAGAARPAGAMWHAGDGALMRVAQDCRGGYGIGLTICRVDRLDARAFAQTVVERVGPPEDSGADGTHTLGRAGDFEVIDLRFPPVTRRPSRSPPPSPARG